mmetsp:Transcript_119887/g.344425  ORF Transcript_119887/g.344425 Transcript_119887/m.344425 type:complete len:380 (+) Transcript_119887:75-1214(+)
MQSKMRIFGADCCKPCPISLHVVAVAWVSCLPAACCFAASSRPVVAAAVCFAVIASPRLMWQRGVSTAGVRFHTAMGLYWNYVYGNFFLSPLLILGCCYQAPWLFMPMAALYAVSVRLSRPELGDGRPWRWFAEREWGYHAFRTFLSLRLHVPETLRDRPSEQPVVFAVHPHGVASDYRVLMDGMLYEALPGRSIFTLAASILFYIPFVRELCLWTRCIDASRSVAARALKRGHSLMVIPGGELEQIRTKMGREEVTLSTRTGFVRLALQSGAALVPCYAFGCVDLYTTFSALASPREWLRKRLGICIPLYWGSIGVLPKQLPVDVVMGDPVDFSCAKHGDPTAEEVVLAHAEYIAALRCLFDTNKDKFGYGDRELIIV